MLVASDDATFGSVIAKAERILPSSSGSSHCFFCSGLPYRSMVSMLPVSGAEQLKTSGAMGERPMISQSGAYSRLVSPRSEEHTSELQSLAYLVCRLLLEK